MKYLCKNRKLDKAQVPGESRGKSVHEEFGGWAEQFEQIFASTGEVYQPKLDLFMDGKEISWITHFQEVPWVGPLWPPVALYPCVSLCVKYM